MKINVFGKNYEWDETKIKDKNKFDFLCLNITRRCNLACSYCFCENYPEENKNLDMSFDIAKLAVDKYLNNKVNKISFFGGEPLLNFDLIYNVVNYLKKFNKKSFNITTNATLINEEIAEFLLKNNFSMIVSLDGNKEIHDLYRKNKNGEGSFEKVWHGLNILRNVATKLNIKNMPITLRSTYSDFSNINLFDRMLFLKNCVENNLASNFSIEPIHSFSKKLTKKEKNNIEKNYEISAKYWVEVAKENKFIPFFHITKTLDRLLSSQNFITECGAGVGMIDISVEGKIYPCHREEKGDIGNIIDGIDFEKQKEWEKRTSWQKMKCGLCWNRNICGGGCRMNSIFVKNNILEQNENECFFRKLFTKTAIYIFNNLSEENIFYYRNRNINIEKKITETLLKQNKFHLIENIIKEKFINYKEKENILNNNFCEFCK